MFEVEQNFNLSEEEKSRLLSGAEAVKTKTFTDIYYDTPAFDLTRKDWWLRNRDGGFELKQAMDMTEGSATDQYLEIEDEAQIRKILELPDGGDMTEILTQNTYRPFCTCTTTRQTYTKAGFTIVLDHVTYPDCAWTFDTCEIELLVEQREQMPAAAQRINQFAINQGLRIEILLGKVVEYLKRERPEHFNALQAGVVRAEK